MQALVLVAPGAVELRDEPEPLVTADERLIGVFGAATVHEDDALRAIRASLEAAARPPAPPPPS